MSPIIWENCRLQDGSLDLVLAYRMTGCRLTEQAVLYLSMVSRIMPITSRQAAAVAIASAMDIVERERSAPLVSHRGGMSFPAGV